MTSKQDLIDRATSLGLTVRTWSPGDGATRYRFFLGPSDYFGPEDPLYTALGLREARVWLHGYSQCWIVGRVHAQAETET